MQDQRRPGVQVEQGQHQGSLRPRLPANKPARRISTSQVHQPCSGSAASAQPEALPANKQTSPRTTGGRLTRHPRTHQHQCVQHLHSGQSSAATRDARRRKDIQQQQQPQTPKRGLQPSAAFGAEGDVAMEGNERQERSTQGSSGSGSTNSAAAAATAQQQRPAATAISRRTLEQPCVVRGHSQGGPAVPGCYQACESENLRDTRGSLAVQPLCRSARGWGGMDGVPQP